MLGFFLSLAPSIRKSTPSAWVTTMIFVSGATSRWLRMLRNPLVAWASALSMW